MEINKVYNGDCLELMKEIGDKSIDMILCDLPYGKTECEWDIQLDLDLLWLQYKRIIKDNGAIVLTATQPFASELIVSNPKWFRYDWIWKKNNAVGYLNANKMPLRAHESVLVFYEHLPTYHPQKVQGKPYIVKRGGNSNVYNKHNEVTSNNEDGMRYPRSVIYFKSPNGGQEKINSTQKPVALFEYLIKTYSNEGNTVLDNCSGSATTAVAAHNTNRNWICIEKYESNYLSSIERLKKLNIL